MHGHSRVSAGARCEHVLVVNNGMEKLSSSPLHIIPVLWTRNRQAELWSGNRRAPRVHRAVAAACGPVAWSIGLARWPGCAWQRSSSSQNPCVRGGRGNTPAGGRECCLAWHERQGTWEAPRDRYRRRMLIIWISAFCESVICTVTLRNACLYFGGSSNAFVRLPTVARHGCVARRLSGILSLHFQLFGTSSAQPALLIHFPNGSDCFRCCSLACNIINTTNM